MRSLLVPFIALSVGCASTSRPSSSPDAATDASQPALDGSMTHDGDVPTLDGDVIDSSLADSSTDAATRDAAVDGGDMMCGTGNDIRTGAACPDVASGVYAIKTVIDVWWQDDIDPPIIDPGRGFITVIEKATLTDVCEDGSIGRAELQRCGLTLPPLVSWPICTAYQLEAPDVLWDDPSMPRVVTTGMVTDFGVGGVLSLADTNTEHDVRIAFGKLGMSYRATGCGLDGTMPVTFRAMQVDAITSPFCDSLSDPGCRHAAQLDVAMRAQLGAAGSITACTEDADALVGSSSAELVALRAVGCAHSGATTCSMDEILFVDSMLQEYRILAAGAAPPPSTTANPCDCLGGCSGDACPLDQTPSVGPHTAMVRLGDVGDAIDCAAVRAAVEREYPGTGF